MAGAEKPELTQKLVVSSLATMLGVKSCEPYQENEGDPLAQLWVSIKRAGKYLMQVGDGSLKLE